MMGLGRTPGAWPVASVNYLGGSYYSHGERATCIESRLDLGGLFPNDIYNERHRHEQPH